MRSEWLGGSSLEPGSLSSGSHVASRARGSEKGGSRGGDGPEEGLEDVKGWEGGRRVAGRGAQEQRLRAEIEGLFGGEGLGHGGKEEH